MNALLPLFRRRQAGFGAIAAIVVLVILAALAAAMTRFGSIQHMTSAQDVLAVRALAAARSGVEWGLHQALKPSPTVCGSKNLAGEGLDGFTVSVTCAQSAEFREGESAAGIPEKISLYTLTATACNMPTAAGACPNAAAVTVPGYVERVLEVVVNK